MCAAMLRAGWEVTLASWSCCRPGPLDILT